MKDLYFKIYDYQQKQTKKSLEEIKEEMEDIDAFVDCIRDAFLQQVGDDIERCSAEELVKTFRRKWRNEAIIELFKYADALAETFPEEGEPC